MPEPPRFRVLIVEDEPLGAARLTDLLEQDSETELLGIVEHADEAVEAIRRLQPDLVFLDIQILGGTGIDVVRAIGPDSMPATVFVTAYDRYALEAFQLAAVDYLLKPYSDERFEAAFQRARRRVQLDQLDTMRQKLLELVEAESAVETPSPQYVDRLAVPSRGRMRVVQVADVQYITASGVYAELHVGGETYLIRESLQTLEEQLDPAVFFRIHRSAIVRLDQIELLLRGSGGSYRVQLRSGVKLRVGRSRRSDLEERLGRR